MDAIELLKQDHEHVKQLFKEYEEAKEDPQRKLMIAEQVIRELMIHERIEEDIFYPAFREAAVQAKSKEDKELVAEAKEEHHVVNTIIDELQMVNLHAEEFDAKFKVMQENVEHHIEEEESEMFKDARKLLKDQLDDLGEAMLELKESLQTELGPQLAQQR